MDNDIENCVLEMVGFGLGVLFFFCFGGGYGVLFFVESLSSVKCWVKSEVIRKFYVNKYKLV